MRSIILALFVAICCMVVYTNAAALPENPAESREIIEPQPEEFNDNDGIVETI